MKSIEQIKNFARDATKSSKNNKMRKLSRFNFTNSIQNKYNVMMDLFNKF